jgi:hypothetical protein
MKRGGDLLASEGPEVDRAASRDRRLPDDGLYCASAARTASSNGCGSMVPRCAAVEALPVTDDPLHDLEQIGVTYRRWALDNATTYGIMFNRSVPDFAPSAEAMEVSIGTFAIVVDAVRRAQAKGHFAEAQPEDIAQVVWAMAHGSVSLEIAGMTGPYPERMPAYRSPARPSWPGSTSPAGNLATDFALMALSLLTVGGCHRGHRRARSAAVVGCAQVPSRS